MAFDPLGNIYVSYPQSNNIYKQNQLYFPTTSGGIELNTPLGLCYLNNTLYIADWGHSRIVAYNGTTATTMVMPIQPYGLCAIGSILYISGQDFIYRYDTSHATTTGLQTTTRLQTTTGPATSTGPTATMIGRNADILSSTSASATSSGWQSAAYVIKAFSGAVTMSFSPDMNTNNPTYLSNNQYGFTETPTATGAYTFTYLKYAMSMNGNGVYIWENGTSIEQVGGPADINTIGSIVYDGTSVEYYVNGKLVRTSTPTHNSALYAYVAFESIGCKFKNLQTNEPLYTTTRLQTTTGLQTTTRLQTPTTLVIQNSGSDFMFMCTNGVILYICDNTSKSVRQYNTQTNNLV